MIEIKVNNIDRTNLIDWRSVQWEQNLTSEVDILRFAYKRYGSKNYLPTLSHEVSFKIDGVKVFGGTVIEIERHADAGGLFEVCIVTCKDFSYLADQFLVVKIYENQLMS